MYQYMNGVFVADINHPFYILPMSHSKGNPTWLTHITLQIIIQKGRSQTYKKTVYPVVESKISERFWKIDSN